MVKKGPVGHTKRTVFILVQLEDVPISKLPRVYIATPLEIADRLKATTPAANASTP